MDIVSKINAIIESDGLMYTKEDLEKVHKEIETKINAPFVKVFRSSIGDGTHIIFKISLDEKKDWPNNIFENSRHFQFSLEPYLTKSNLELYSKDYKVKEKFRKAKAKSVEDAIKRVNAYLDKVRKEAK